ncbi:hypothetical protein BDR22DRAFT_822202 [Usnea florida]
MQQATDSSNPTGELRRLGGSIIATWLIALIAVCLRFLARRLSKAALWYDDWLIIPAVLVATALCFISTTWMVNSTIAQWKWMNDGSSIGVNYFEKDALLGFFISQICWSLNPIGHLDDCSSCNVLGSFSGCTIPHIVTDAMLLIFPMPLVWKLQMRRSQKVMLTVVFALGGFVTVMSAVRLGLFFTESVDDNTYDPPFLLTNIEINTSIICACLPSLGPIITFLFAKVAQLRKRKSTHERGSKLLKDTLPIYEGAASSPVTRSARHSSWSDGPNPVLDLLPTVEAEANPHVPESGAETPGQHVLEMETMESVSAMETSGRSLGLESQRPIAKLEGTARMPPLPRRSVR